MSRLLAGLRKKFCSHRFAIEDLKNMHQPEPARPDASDYAGWVKYHSEFYESDYVRKRVRCPCSKCGKVFFAHCGLDVLKNGPMFWRKNA